MTQITQAIKNIGRRSHLRKSFTGLDDAGSTPLFCRVADKPKADPDGSFALFLPK
ncbi:MAG: hypothetical protein K8963_10025 [Proteobacteria bacterium]|nr:hypothetical protein [Pseudomonadota bacterium]